MESNQASAARKQSLKELTVWMCSYGCEFDGKLLQDFEDPYTAREIVCPLCQRVVDRVHKLDWLVKRRRQTEDMLRKDRGLLERVVDFVGKLVKQV